MSEINTDPPLELAVNYSFTRQHYTMALDESGSGLAVCDTDAMRVRVKKQILGENELPLCRRCVSIARLRGLLPQEA